MPMAKGKNPKPPREFWGDWQDRSYVCDKHPTNIRMGFRFFHTAKLNELFSVQYSTEETEWGAVEHLWIRRHDGKPLIWREMQRIKNELMGVERVAVEVYPPVSMLVDDADMYHLWVLPEGFTLPFTIAKKG